jgi:hypothetical protein
LATGSQRGGSRCAGQPPSWSWPPCSRSAARRPSPPPTSPASSSGRCACRRAWPSTSGTTPATSTAQVERRLRFLRANDFHTVYLDVGNYLDAAELPDSDPQKQARLSAVRQQIKRFVATAAGFGLSVQALGGGPTWTGELRRYLGPKLVELVGDYNTRVRSGERLRGVHLDLEPYTLPGWLDDEHVEGNLVE